MAQWAAFDPARRLPDHLRSYRDCGAWREQSLPQLALQRAEQSPSAIAIEGSGERLSFAALLRDAQCLAVSLHELGLRPGDRVCFQLPNWIETAVINLALNFACLVAVPIVPIYRDAEMRQMLGDCGCSALIVTDVFRGFDYAAMAERIRLDLPELRHVIRVRPRSDAPLDYHALVEAGRRRSLPQCAESPDAAKVLLYTSGTTGRAKGVLHSQNTINAVLDMCIRHWRVEAGESVLMPSPVTHLTGFGFLELPLLTGSSTVLMEAWNPSEAVRLIQAHRIVGTVSATPFLKELIEAAEAAGTRLDSMRFFACGGAAVPPELIRHANLWMGRPVAFRIFGCTEAPLVSMGFLDQDLAELAATTDGQVKDYDVRIVDSARRPVADGGEGEIAVRGPAMMLGYLDPAQTAEAIDAEGFYHTGDLGILTPEDAIVVTGREKDLIIRGGENISAKEVEDVLHRHDDIADAAVVGMPHERLGEGVCAFVVPRPGATVDASAWTAFVAGSSLARQKVPELILVVDELPRTPAGKVRKDLLRERARDHVHSGALRQP